MSRVSTRGFTLIEMMIVVAVIGILAAIAYPRYNQYILRSARADAEGVMLQASLALQRHYGNAFTYVGADTTAYTQSPTSGTARYTIAFTLDNAKPHEFLITATPTGAQTSDSCGNLTLDETGNKGASSGSVGDCW